MHNGQGTGDTETGAYTLNGATIGTAPAKNGGAKFYIPTENEWCKAAYYSPLLNSGSGGYYTYATQSNTAPGNVVGAGSNRANYYNGVFSVTQSSGLGTFQNYLTNVGAFTDSVSYYGTFDQSGNVGEWNDLTGAADSTRGFRGGNWLLNAFDTSSANRNAAVPSAEGSGAGFRLASPVPVPEPSTWVLGVSGIACAGWAALARAIGRSSVMDRLWLKGDFIRDHWFTSAGPGTPLLRLTAPPISGKMLAEIPWNGLVFILSRNSENRQHDPQAPGTGRRRGNCQSPAG